MKPTAAHFALWARRSAPSWAKGIALPVASGIDGIVNAKIDPAYARKGLSLSNALALLVTTRKNYPNSRDLCAWLAGYSQQATCASANRLPHYHRFARGMARGMARRAA